MKAFEVKKELESTLLSGNYKFLRVNFANGDMVGHTGDIDAAIIAAETVDKCVKDIVEIVNELGGITIITADHGNIDEMEEHKTAHTLNPVMFAIADSNYYDMYHVNKKYIINENLQEPALGNVASTILNLLGYEKPDGYLDSLITFT